LIQTRNFPIEYVMITIWLVGVPPKLLFPYLLHSTHEVVQLVVWKKFLGLPADELLLLVVWTAVSAAALPCFTIICYYKCPLCIQPMAKRIKQMNRYVREDYEKLVMRCAYSGCTETFCWTKQPDHELQCIHGPRVECEHCQENLHPKKMIDHHMLLCNSFPVKCWYPGCHAKVPRSQMNTHRDTHDAAVKKCKLDQARSICLHLQLLLHTVKCEVNCESTNCNKMKVSFGKTVYSPY
jgi:hypothetical protein